MSEKKKVDPKVVAIALKYGARKAENEAPGYFDLFPPAILPDPAEVDRDEWIAFVGRMRKKYEPMMQEDLAEFFGVSMPDVSDEDLYNPTNPPDEEPSGPLFGYKYKTRVLNSGEEMSHRDTSDPSKPQTFQDIFRPSGCGRNYGGQIMVIWSDGETMIVKDASKRHYHGAWDDKRKWQPGCGDGTTELCEAYSKVGTHPEYMDIYHNFSGSDQPSEDEWVKIEWGGDPSLGWGGHDSRDRTWWTKIHGDHSTPWSRKFPLPKSVEDAKRIDFEFSDGSTLKVSNPKKMKMNDGGPKYRPEEPGENDPRKSHPKVGAIPKSPVTWVKYKTG